MQVSLEEGQPHERKFVLTCKVGKFADVGMGKSKKHAKRMSAHKMLQRLKTMPVETDEANFHTVDEDELAQGIAMMSKDLRSKNTNKLGRYIRAKEGPLICSLHTIDLESEKKNAPEYLADICNEQHYKLEFIEIEEITKSGRYQTLVQISTTPVAVCFGTGQTRETSKVEAAFSALQYLKLMTYNISKKPGKGTNESDKKTEE